MSEHPSEMPETAEESALLAIAANAPTIEFDSTTVLAAEDVEDRKQNRGLRKTIAIRLIWMLSAELMFLGLMIIFQGFTIWGFHLQEWVFSIFTTSVLAQTFLLVRVVVKNLFPAES